MTGFTKRENILLVGAKGQHRCHLIAQSTARTLPRDGAIIFGDLIGKLDVLHVNSQLVIHYTGSAMRGRPLGERACRALDLRWHAGAG